MASVIVPDAELLAKITKTSSENLSKRLNMAGRLETDVNAMSREELIRAALVVFKTHGFVDSTPLSRSRKSCTNPPPLSADLLALMQFMRDEKEKKEKQNSLEKKEREKKAKRDRRE